jgi:hypothetical protein
MINLIDGPFVGNHSLCLDRLPIFLRFIDRRDPKSGKRTGGAFNMATYKHVPEMDRRRGDARQ